MSVLANSPMLLKTYKGDENLTGWVMSEKLDGVRAIWDTKSLKGRSNLAFNPPQIWLKCFPAKDDLWLDGELYSSNLSFEQITSIINSSEDKGWNELKYYIFDAPKASGDLKTRLKTVKDFLDKTTCPQIQIIEQKLAINHEMVHKFLDEISARGGEGVVVRDEKAPYISGRSDKILKLKKFYDSECKVIAHNMGKGRINGLLGSLVCEDLLSGAKFKIGSGFSDEVRKNPPKIGDIITYKYQNLTKNGVPRFPVYLRKKDMKI